MSIPAGFVITPAMIQYFNIEHVYVILAIVANCALYALGSFATCIIGGLPEVNLAETLYDLDNDPFDEEDDFEDLGDEEPEHDETGIPTTDGEGDE